MPVRVRWWVGMHVRGIVVESAHGLAMAWALRTRGPALFASGGIAIGAVFILFDLKSQKYPFFVPRVRVRVVFC